MIIKILGGGCGKCHTLENNTKLAVAELKVQADIVLVTDFAEIAKYGVMSTPALVINEKVMSYGKVLKPKDIASLIEKAGK